MAQICAHFVLMVGQLLARAGHSGQVDVYITLTGVKGAHSASWYMGRGYERNFTGIGVRPTVDTDDFRDHHRTSTQQMLEEPTTVAGALVARLARVIRPPQLADPLEVRQ